MPTETGSAFLVAASLGACIREHEERMEAARDLVRLRPDLLFPAPAEPQATPEPPAVPEEAQPTRKGTTGHPPKKRTATQPATPIDQARSSNQTKPASEMARACLLRNLQDHFEAFLDGAKLHELYLLDSVFMLFDSSNLGPDSVDARSPLADSFMWQLDSDDTYIKVPRDRISLVEDFLETLDSIPDVDEPAPGGRSKLVVFPVRQLSQEEPNAS